MTAIERLEIGNQFSDLMQEIKEKAYKAMNLLDQEDLSWLKKESKWYAKIIKAVDIVDEKKVGEGYEIETMQKALECLRVYACEQTTELKVKPKKEAKNE